MFGFPQPGDEGGVVGVEGVEPSDDLFDPAGAEDGDASGAVGGGGVDVADGGVCDDGHRVGATERVGASRLGDVVFEEGEDEPCSGGDGCGDWGEAVGPGIFGMLGLGFEGFVVGPVDGDGGPLGSGAAVEAAEDAVGGGVGGDLEEPL